MKEFEESDWRWKIPIYINSFNNLDLTEPDDVAVAFRIAEMWNKVTGKHYVQLPIKGDTRREDMEANLPLNLKNIYKLHEIWNKRVDDIDSQKAFFNKCEQSRALEADKERSEKD